MSQKDRSSGCCYFTLTHSAPLTFTLGPSVKVSNNTSLPHLPLRISLKFEYNSALAMPPQL